MSNIGIITDMYFEYSNGNRVKYGTRRLIIPVIDNPDGLSSGSWDTCVNYLDANKFTVFGINHFQPTGAGYEAPKPFNDGLVQDSITLSWSSIEDWYFNDIRKVIFDIQDRSAGHREIILDFNGITPDFDGNDKGMSFFIKYYKDEDLYLTIPGSTRTAYYQSGNNQINYFRQFSSIPWLGKYNDEEDLWGVYVSADYQKHLDPGHGWYPTSNPSVGIYGGSFLTQFKSWLGEYEPEEYNPEDDPFDPGGTTTPGGGDGNFSDDSDIPEEDDLPDEQQYSANASGFITLFNPTLPQLKNLAGLFWNDTFAGAIRNFVENITDMFISLAMVPFTVPSGATKSVTWFGIATGVDLRLCAQQFYDIDMGSIDLGGDGRIFTSGSALDYSPYSQLGIYLPFIGYRELDIDECRNAVLSLRYRFDLLSGECVAIIKVDGAALYSFTGNCLASIPITSQSMDQLINAAINVAIAGVAGAEGAVAASSGEAAKSAQEGASISETYMHEHQHVSEGAFNSLLSATANNAMAIKPRYSKSGSMSGTASMLSVLQPFLFLKTPRQAIPLNYNKYCGYPSNITDVLGNFSGYTVVEDIRLNGLVATSAEVAEIYQLLKKGVII